MVFKVKISHIILSFLMLLVTPHLTVASTADVQQLITGMGKFGSNLFAELAKVKEYSEANLIISPFSIQNCLIMARMGAEGETACQIDRHAFNLGRQERKTLAANYNVILAEYENSTVVKTANKIYAMTGYSEQDEFKELLTNELYSSVDFLNFKFNEDAAKEINTWIEERTNNFIQNLVDPSSLSGDTRLVLVNAVYFNSSWLNQFDDYDTSKQDFHLDDVQTTKVDMMYNKQYFNYAVLSDLNALAVELPYEDEDFSMLIILPNEPSGLTELEKRLKEIALADIVQQMELANVKVYLPKFKAVFEAELTQPLSQMGLNRMFSDDAEFGKMLIPSAGLKVSSVAHKAYIEVNERGTDASAATMLGFEDRIAVTPVLFEANRPFHYVIKNKANLVLFEGNVRNPNLQLN